MPYNGNGVFTPDITFVPDTPALAEDVNANFTDVADGLSNALTRDGQAGMTAPFLADSGSEAQPGITFVAEDTTGFYRVALNIVGFSIAGVEAFRFTVDGLSGKGATPIGSGMDFWGTVAPQGWLFAYGQAVSQTTYASLFAILGTTYNTGGEGPGNFRLPDKRGRASFGKDDMGGSGAGRLTNAATGGIVGTTLGAGGGEQAHTPTLAELFQHTHTQNIHDHTYSVTGFAPAAAAGGVSVGFTLGSVNTGGTIAVNQNTGSSSPFNEVPPGIVCNYIIFAGV